MNASTTEVQIDLTYLDMMADGDDFMKKTMLDMLLEEMPPELEKLRGAYLAQDGEELRQVAHKMKSTLAFVGNIAMTDANAALEVIGKENTELQRAAIHLTTLETLAPGVLNALRAESAEIAI